MTTPEALLELADRVEREEPSRIIDGEVACAAGWLQVYHRPKYRKLMGISPDRPRGLSVIPSYTTSLDAAVTLYKRKPEVISSDPRKVCAEALRQWT